MSDIYKSYGKKKIIHVDMDSFFASIEIRDNPSLATKPVAIGGLPDKRGVIATSNYTARQYGVHSAMSTAKALALCPKLIVIYPNMEKYQNTSKKIKKIFHAFTNKIEPLSLDEAYLDVTDCNACHGSATLIAIKIKALIYQQENLIASAGIAPNKFLAKVASDWKKPNGLFVIPPEQVDSFVLNLSVNKIPGVGAVMAEKLEKFGILTCKNLRAYPLTKLQEMFGKMGIRLYYFARGIDPREVETSRARKSLSVEETFAQDIVNHALCLDTLVLLIKKLTSRLVKYQHEPIHKLFIKIKFANFTGTTVEKIYHKVDLTVFQQLLTTGLERNQTMPVRLLGIGVKFIEKFEITWEQLSLPEPIEF